MEGHDEGTGHDGGFGKRRTGSEPDIRTEAYKEQMWERVGYCSELDEKKMEVELRHGD